jgi:hypothetical protein
MEFLQNIPQLFLLPPSIKSSDTWNPIFVASEYLPLQVHILSNQHNHHPQKITPQEPFDAAIVMSNLEFS